MKNTDLTESRQNSVFTNFLCEIYKYIKNYNKKNDTFVPSIHKYTRQINAQ